MDHEGRSNFRAYWKQDHELCYFCFCHYERFYLIKSFKVHDSRLNDPNLTQGFFYLSDHTFTDSSVFGTGRKTRWLLL